MTQTIKTVILARGGSKGIPRKNIIDVNGKPLLHYTIEAAKASKANDVYVSTDCCAIMRSAIDANANVLMRPKDLAGDNTKSEDALIHFVETIACDAVVFLQPTSPLVLSEDIDNAIEMMKDHDSVFSAYKEHWIPRWSCDGKPDGWHPLSRPMRQDRAGRWVENGAIYIVKRDLLIANRIRYGGQIGIVEMPMHRSFQVDTMDDLELIKKCLT